MEDVFAYAVKEYEEIGARFFSVYVDSIRSLSILEVPPEFTAMMGWPGCADCDIVTSNNTEHEFRVRFDRTGVIARSVGDGWPNFLRENKIRRGKFIVFKPADERTLVAALYPPANTPEFTKTLCVSHTSPLKSAKLDIPCAFWRRYGSEQFDQRYFTLRGPSCSVTVTAVVKKTPKQTSCYFTRGWAEFRDSNSFKVGDTLFFTQIGRANFQVVEP